MSYKAHLFVCTNAPENSAKCGGKGSEELRRDLKSRCAQAFGKDVRVNASGCLGHCERGIAAVLYPSGQWFFEVSSASAEDRETLFSAVQTQVSSDKDKGI